MTEHKFEFTVSGYELSEHLKHKIATDIAVLVANAVVSQHPGVQIGSVLIGSNINPKGGRLLDLAMSKEVVEFIDSRMSRPAAPATKT